MISHGKKQLIEILEIADINILISIKELTSEDVTKKIKLDINSIEKIFNHCLRQMDKYLAKSTQERKSIADLTFGDSVEIYLEVSESFLELVRNIPEDDYSKPIDKGEKLVTIIQRISLHFMGHLGQIYLIRRFLGKEISSIYSFVLALSEGSRRKLRKEWESWWNSEKHRFL